MPGENLLLSKRFQTRQLDSERAGNCRLWVMAKGHAGSFAGSRGMAGKIVYNTFCPFSANPFRLSKGSTVASIPNTGWTVLCPYSR